MCGIQFSADGNTLAVASFDSKIYLYDVGNAYALRGTITKHNSYITQFDFSADSQYVQSNCGAYELIFSEADTGHHVPAASRLRDVRWRTWNCTLGWASQGLWTKALDGMEIASVDRSESEKLLAVGDEFGRVRLYNYPCIDTSAVFKQYRGHSSHITKVRWTGGDSHLLTVGGHDRSVFQWKHVVDDVGEEDSKQAQMAGESGEDSDLPKKDAEFQLEEVDTTEAAASKPWHAVIVPPSKPPPMDVSLPSQSLELAVWECGILGGP